MRTTILAYVIALGGVTIIALGLWGLFQGRVAGRPGQVKAERGEKLFDPSRSASLYGRTSLSRFAHGRRLVHLRQRFVRRSHSGQTTREKHYIHNGGRRLLQTVLGSRKVQQ